VNENRKLSVLFKSWEFYILQFIFLSGGLQSVISEKSKIYFISDQIYYHERNRLFQSRLYFKKKLKATMDMPIRD
jgi:hypothetical protein